MTTTHKTTLSVSDKARILDLWNKEYPNNLAYTEASFYDYLNQLEGVIAFSSYK